MSDLSPLSGEERKSNFGAVRSVDDPIQTLDAWTLANIRLGLSPSWNLSRYEATRLNRTVLPTHAPRNARPTLLDTKRHRPYCTARMRAAARAWQGRGGRSGRGRGEARAGQR